MEILVADDVKDILKLMCSWLEAEGHKVTPVSSGWEIIRCVREKEFDLVVTDLLMPEGDGWEAILVVCRLRPRTRILAISGGGEQMQTDACLRVARGVGADAVLRKPFQQEQFLAAVRQVAPT